MNATINIHTLKQSDYVGLINPRCWYFNNGKPIWDFFNPEPLIKKSGINLLDEFKAKTTIKISEDGQNERLADLILSQSIIMLELFLDDEQTQKVWTRCYRIVNHSFVQLDRSVLELQLTYEPFYNYYSKLAFNGFFNRTTLENLTYKTNDAGQITWINPYSLKQSENIKLELTQYSITKMDEFVDVSLYFLNTNAVLNKDTVKYAAADIYDAQPREYITNLGTVQHSADTTLNNVKVVSDGVFWVTLFDQNLGFVFSNMSPFESFNDDYYAKKISQAAIVGHVRSVPVPWAIRYQQSFLKRKHWQPFLNKRGDQRIDTSVGDYLDFIHRKRQPLPIPRPYTSSDLPSDLSTVIFTIKNDYDRWARGFRSEKEYWEFCTFGDHNEHVLDFSKEFSGWNPKVNYLYSNITYFSPWGSTQINPLTSIQLDHSIKITPIYVPTWVDCLTSLVVAKNFFNDRPTIYYNHKKVFNYTSTNKYQDYFATNILSLPLEKFQRSWSAAFSVLGSLTTGAASMAGSVASGNPLGAISGGLNTISGVGNAIMDRVQFQNSLEQKKAFKNVESQSSGVFDYFQQLAIEKVAQKMDEDDTLDTLESNFSYVQIETPPTFLKKALNNYLMWFGWQTNQFYYFSLTPQENYYQFFPLKLRNYEYFEITNFSWAPTSIIPRIYRDYFERVFRSGIFIINNPTQQLYNINEIPYNYGNPE